MAGIRKLKSQIRVITTRRIAIQRKMHKARAGFNFFDKKIAALTAKRDKFNEAIHALNQRDNILRQKVEDIQAQIANGGKKVRAPRT
jgi:prefoldin subunit 5